MPLTGEIWVTLDIQFADGVGPARYVAVERPNMPVSAADLDSHPMIRHARIQ